MRSIGYIPVLLTLTMSPAWAQSIGGQSGGGQAALSGDDKNFLDYAAKDNQAEIQACLLAEKKARSLAVKAFARLMVDDHVQIESQLATIIEGTGADVSNGVGSEGQDTLDQLSGLAGAKFDQEFINDQIKDHTDDVKKFTAERKTTHNRALQEFTEVTIPILQQHLQLALAVQAAQRTGTAESPEGTTSGGTTASSDSKSQ